MDIKELLVKMNEYILDEHAWQNACGQELSVELVQKLREQNKSIPQLSNMNKDSKISWLIRYMDITPKDKLIGIKISDIGTICYIENGEKHEQSICLAVGDTDSMGNLKLYSGHGLVHMKYGYNRHWDKSKRALHAIPNKFIDGEILAFPEPAKYIHYYKFRNNHYMYVIGVPSDRGDATVLVTCLHK